MESDNTGSPDLPELMISQIFELLKSLTFGKIKKNKLTLKSFSIQTNILFRETEPSCTLVINSWLEKTTIKSKNLAHESS